MHGDMGRVPRICEHAEAQVRQRGEREAAASRAADLPPNAGCVYWAAKLSPQGR